MTFTTPLAEKKALFELGKRHVRSWCERNLVLMPAIIEDERVQQFTTCAYYRQNTIYIWPPACAAVGHAGRTWSFPGYVVDRTPFGVLAHELGHHVDKAHGAQPGTMSSDLRRETQEDPITRYAPNDNEWFAEIFRLFVTNPDLLRLLRPKMFAKLSARYASIELRRWDEVLCEERQRKAAANKIANVR